MIIIAHRAGTDRYPEQSLASVHHSLTLGADYAEVDVRLTKDEIPFVCHDPNALRVFGLDAAGEGLAAKEFGALRHVADPAMGTYTLGSCFRWPCAAPSPLQEVRPEPARRGAPTDTDLCGRSFWACRRRSLFCRSRVSTRTCVFPSSGALLKALYLATFQLTRKWTLPLRNWGAVHAELSIMSPDRMS